VSHSFRRFVRGLLGAHGETRDVEMAAGTTGWLPAQRHAGHNIGDSDTHVLFVELKRQPAEIAASLGPE
jgi:oxalate decarboxylase/phosphoglucose isomerase-like protein (cupin superfamily)